MISFITLFSRLRMLVNINSWCEATSLILNVSMGSLAFYLTKCLRFILYSFLLLIITFFVAIYVTFTKLYLRTYIWWHFYLSVWTLLISKEIFCNSSVAIVLFIFIIHISYIISAFWRYRSKSRSRSRLLEYFFLLSLELK